MADDRNTERDRDVPGADDQMDDMEATGADDGAGDGPEARERSYSAPQVQELLDEQRDKYLRLAAEYDNFRKRSAKERQEAGPRAQAELVRSLLDPLDDLGRVAHVDPASTDLRSVMEGVELVERKLLKTLGGAGLETIDPVDQPFNPELHEAVATEPALSSEDDHMVARVYQVGYLFKGQLLRPARVVVKQWNG